MGERWRRGAACLWALSLLGTPLTGYGSYSGSSSSYNPGYRGSAPTGAPQSTPDSPMHTRAFDSEFGAAPSGPGGGRGPNYGPRGVEGAYEESNGAMGGEYGGEGGVVDAVGVLRQTSVGRCKVALASGVSGASLGLALSAYVVHKPMASMLVGLLLAGGLSFTNGNAGALSQALGATLLLTLQRLGDIRGQYPILRQLKCVLVRRRHRYPPNAPRNLWRYGPWDGAPLRFSMPVVILAAGTMGLLAGRTIADVVNLFIVPDWLISVAVAGVLVYGATLESTVGDFDRCVAMKAVGIVGLVLDAASETQVPSKTFAVAGQLGKKMAWVDRKYHVTRRVSDAAGWAIARMSGSADEGGTSGPREQRHGGRGRGARGRGGRGRGRSNRRGAETSPSAEEYHGDDYGYSGDSRPSQEAYRGDSFGSEGGGPYYPTSGYGDGDDSDIDGRGYGGSGGVGDVGSSSSYQYGRDSPPPRY